MLRDWLAHALTPCPAPWKRLGYLREQIAIDARATRLRVDWADHLANSRAAIRQALSTMPPGRSALVLGAGQHHDLPLAELCGRFREVWLADLVHLSLIHI
jgi:hypothetical protein